MVSVKNTEYYNEVLKELTYDFASVFIFKGFVVMEINEGVVYTWKNHGKMFVDDLSKYLEAEEQIVYISNRIYSYSVVAQDWLKFLKSNYGKQLKKIYVVSPNQKGSFNLMIERLFLNRKVKTFATLKEAINSAKHNITNNE